MVKLTYDLTPKRKLSSVIQKFEIRFVRWDFARSAKHFKWQKL
jgi:hypothetical protein